MHILFCLSYLLILWTLSKSYCVTCSRILPLSVFCVLQGSGVTPLKCGEIYDMDFVANFKANATVENFESRSTFVKLMNECIVAQFLLRHGVLLLDFQFRVRSCEIRASVLALKPNRESKWYYIELCLIWSQQYSRRWIFLPSDQTKSLNAFDNVFQTIHHSWI